MEKNVGDWDRIIRLIFLIVFLYLAITVSAWFWVLVVADGFTIITRSCYFYKLLGITTLKKKKRK